jgi:predicted metalloprotease with PDZ domain
MREVDLSLFDFDFDLTWMGFFLSPAEKVYGRYGGRDGGSADSRVSVQGLCYALEAALQRHNAEQYAGEVAASKRAYTTVADLPAFRRLPANACVHCHQVYDLRRESLQAAGKWSLDEVWVYPQPENIGLTLEVDRGDRVQRVTPDSPADRAGLRAGDRLTRIEGHSVASIADVQYALHLARNARSVELEWAHDNELHRQKIDLQAGWQKTDVSWRWSLRGLDPEPPLRGDDLSESEKFTLGLRPGRLAFRQGPFLSPAAEQAGVRQNDVVVGVDGKSLQMTARQFGAYIRLGYKVGDRLKINLLRGGQPIDVDITLVGRSR